MGSGNQSLESGGVTSNFQTETTSIYLASSLAAAALLAVFLDPLSIEPHQEESSSEPEQISGLKLLSATIRQLGSLKQLFDRPAHLLFRSRAGILWSRFHRGLHNLRLWGSHCRSRSRPLRSCKCSFLHCCRVPSQEGGTSAHLQPCGWCQPRRDCRH